MKLDLFGNKARGGRVSCLAALFGRQLVPFGPRMERYHMAKSGSYDHGQDWAAVPLAIVDKTLAG